MARTPAQRGSFGRWLTQVRTERYERQVDALADMRRLMGLHISPSEYSQWEAGSRVPRVDNPKVAQLYEFFGSRPEEAPGSTETGDALVEAIRAQTAAISELVAALRDTSAETEIRLRVLEAVALPQGLPADEGSPERSAPRATAG